MKTININGCDYTVEQLTEILQNAKKETPMQKVFEYHKTTEEDFEELYKNIPDHVKAYEKECLVVAFYNKGWKPKFDGNERFYYTYFYMDNFRLVYVDEFRNFSVVSARLLFKNESDLREAVEVYKDVFKASRLG